MTRHQGFDIWVAPDVEVTLHQGDARLSARFAAEMWRVRQHGTRSRTAKKLGGLALWEIRVGDHRAFFCLVPGTRRIAVGALVRKDRRKLRMSRLRNIERRVHAWRDRLMEEGDEVGGS